MGKILAKKKTTGGGDRSFRLKNIRKTAQEAPSKAESGGKNET